MKSVKGYLTDDGTFFDNATDAEFYDALQALSLTAKSQNINPERLITAIDLSAKEVGRYLNAKYAKEKSDEQKTAIEFESNNGVNPYIWSANEQRGDNPNALIIDHADNGRAEEDIPSFLNKQASVDEPMPNVGSGVSTETIRDNGSQHGAGSWGSDASSVRSNPDMAIALSHELAEARFRGRQEDI